MAELPVSIAAPNFRAGQYMDKNGQMRRMIEFSEDVLTNVLAVVGADRRVQGGEN
jgi:hypothetical protein